MSPIWNWPEALAPVELMVAPSDQFRRQRDRCGRERLRKRALSLRGFGDCLELGRVDARDPRSDLEGDRRDREALADLLEVHAGCHAQLLGRMPCVPKREGERHRVAARMCGAEQFLGVRAGLAVLAL